MQATVKYKQFNASFTYVNKFVYYQNDFHYCGE